MEMGGKPTAGGGGYKLTLLCTCFALVGVLAQPQVEAARARNWGLSGDEGDEGSVSRGSTHRCADATLLDEASRLLAGYSVECDASPTDFGSGVSSGSFSSTPLPRWAKLVRSGGGGGNRSATDFRSTVLVASAGGPTAQLLYDALEELGDTVVSLGGGGSGGGGGVMYRPLPAAKRWLEVRRVRVGKAVYVVDGRACLFSRSPRCRCTRMADTTTCTIPHAPPPRQPPPPSLT
jgi:hypothetical protein